MIKSKFISPLTWPGGKAKQWNLIKSYFPKNTEKMVYIEPFFGEGSCGLNALRENLFKNYHFNDIDENLINFWNWFVELKNDNSFNDIINQIPFFLFYPISNLEKLKNSEMISTNKNLLFLVNNNLTFNGQSWGTLTQKRLEQNWNCNKRNRIDLCFDLLKANENKIKFSNFNFLSNWSTIKFNESLFMYLDPPYFSNKGKPYKYKFTIKQFNEFKNKVDEYRKLGIKILISLDDCFEVRELFKDYYIHEAEWKYTSSNTKGNKKCKLGKELFITNYEVKNEN
ncbi:DNA adenine methylase [Spiroplasma endosymbiont of Atherix ibis]|uniref:DNA adenine methylase n=1 Tax=Spiroplasma endosymbiont of Atherix ibis TaxID=3066291 RepID=UPI0030D098C5